MTPWISFPLTLSGDTVDLISLDASHIGELLSVAGDKRIWEHYAYDGSDPDRLRIVLEGAMMERINGTQFPFAICHRASRKLIGSTRFMEIHQNHHKLEIGTTWLHPDYWGSSINTECKLLLLTYCFETIKTSRVQLRTDERNTRSRKAIEKIGASFEGIFRNDMVRDNLTKRNSAYYSIIEEEWSEKKKLLLEKLNKMK